MSDHMPSNSKIKARWNEGASPEYRQANIDGTKAKRDREDVYNNDEKLQTNLSNITWKKKLKYQPGSKEHCDEYKLDKFKADNAKKPYDNHSHHMIPKNDFFNRFDSEQQEILWQVDYDVNNGNNMIFLPAKADKFRHVHKLPWHHAAGGHKSYSDKVKDAATEIEDEVNKEIDKLKECESYKISDKIAKSLVQYENNLWKIIVNLGPSTINKIKIP